VVLRDLDAAITFGDVKIKIGQQASLPPEEVKST